MCCNTGYLLPVCIQLVHSSNAWCFTAHAQRRRCSLSSLWITRADHCHLDPWVPGAHARAPPWAASSALRGCLRMHRWMMNSAYVVQWLMACHGGSWSDECLITRHVPTPQHRHAGHFEKSVEEEGRVDRVGREGGCRVSEGWRCTGRGRPRGSEMPVIGDVQIPIREGTR